MDTDIDLRYPIGYFIAPQNIDAGQRQKWIKDIENLPHQLENLCKNLNPEDLDLQYRPDSWTVRQLIHHIADSHLSTFLRFRWALTEDKPLIKAYDEKAFAKLSDYQKTPVEITLQLIKSLHLRWKYFLDSMSEGDFQRIFMHPESGPNRLDETLGHYAWHGRHHLAHINLALRKSS